MAEEYFDLKVVDLKRKVQQAAYDSIESGIYINNRLVTFKSLEIFDGKMSIVLPEDMVSMPEKMAKFKYQSENRPQIIYSNEDGSVNFTYSHFELPIKPEETLIAIKQFKNMIKKMQPANIFYDIQEENINEAKLSWFDYKSYAIDSQIYNLVYVMPIKKTVMHGTFNCLFGDAAEWKKAVLPAIRSIVDLTLKKGNEIS